MPTMVNCIFHVAIISQYSCKHECLDFDGAAAVFVEYLVRKCDYSNNSNNNNNNDDDDFYSARIHQLLVLKAHYYPLVIRRINHS